MSDNIVLNSGSGGATLATDDISGTHYQIMKLAHGSLDTANVVSDSDPLPVDDAGGSLTVDAPAGTPVATRLSDGTSFVSAALEDGNLATISGAVHNEDTAHSGGDPGIQALAVRNDTLTALAGTDGDYAPFQVNSSGALYVSVSGVASVDDAGGSLTVDAPSGTPVATRLSDGTSFVSAALEDGNLATIAGAVHNEDAAHSSGDLGVQALAVRNDTLGALAGTDGDYAPFQVNSSGALYVSVSGVASVDDNGSSLTVDNGGTFAVQADSLSGANFSAAEGGGLPSEFVVVAGDDGTDTHPVQLDSSGSVKAVLQSSNGTDIGDVDVASMPDEGQQTMASSISVAIASDQSALDVSGATVNVQEATALDVSASTVTVTDDGNFTLAANDGTDIGDVDVASQPARSRTTDSEAVAQQTDAVMNGTSALTPKFAAIGVNSSGDNTIVSGVTGKKLRILSLFLIARGDVDVLVEDGTNNILGTSTVKLDLTANSGFSLPYNPVGWGETASGNALVIDLGSATGVAGSVTYIEV